MKHGANNASVDGKVGYKHGGKVGRIRTWTNCILGRTEIRDSIDMSDLIKLEIEIEDGDIGIVPADEMENAERRMLAEALKWARQQGMVWEFVWSFGKALQSGDEWGEAIAVANREWDL